MNKLVLSVAIASILGLSACDDESIKDVEENAVLQDLKAYVGMLLSDSSNPSVETNFQSSMDDLSKSPSIEPTWAPSMSNTNYCGASWSAVNNVDDCSWR